MELNYPSSSSLTESSGNRGRAEDRLDGTFILPPLLASSSSNRVSCCKSTVPAPRRGVYPSLSRRIYLLGAVFLQVPPHPGSNSIIWFSALTDLGIFSYHEAVGLAGKWFGFIFFDFS